MRRSGAGALGRWSLPAVIMVTMIGRTLAAQSPTVSTLRTGPAATTHPDTAVAPQRPSVPPLVRYGKWVALGGAVALGLRANALHQDANDSYQALQDRCFQNALACSLLPNGRYADPVSERLYADTRDRDHQAARYLVGAEVSFALAATGFIWELLKHEDRTPNIPFEPRVETGATTTRLGLAFRF